MLLYNKAYDPCHTLLRMCAILLQGELHEIEEERLRILDFLIAFPGHIADMSLPAIDKTKKSSFREFKSVYSSFEPASLFQAMKPIQEAVIGTLCSLGVFERGSATQGRFTVNPQMIPAVVMDVIARPECSLSKDALYFVSEYLKDFSLTGVNGLKARTKLLGYRYDAL